MQLLFPENKFLSHMPFLTNFGGGGQFLFFCKADGPITVKKHNEDQFPVEDYKYYMESYVPWKIHWHDMNPTSTPIRIETGLPDDAIECSPSVYYNNGLFHLTFLGGKWDSERLYLAYNLYKMTGPDLSSLSPPRMISKMRSRLGFYNRNFLAFDDIHNLIKIKDARTGEKFMMTSPFTKTNRLTYMAENESNMIVSGNMNGVDRSFLVDLEAITVKEIVSSIGPVYKCTLFGDNMIFAVKSEEEGSTYEDRKLYQDSYSLIETTEQFDVHYSNWVEAKSIDANAAIGIRKQNILRKTWRTLRGY